MDFEKIATDAAFKMGFILKDKQKEVVVLLLKGNDVLTAWLTSLLLHAYSRAFALINIFLTINIIHNCDVTFLKFRENEQPMLVQPDPSSLSKGAAPPDYVMIVFGKLLIMSYFREKNKQEISQEKLTATLKERDVEIDALKEVNSCMVNITM